MYVIHMYMIYNHYRKHCKSIWKGDKFLKPIRKATPASILVKYSQLFVRGYCYMSWFHIKVQATVYVGWQIGMVVWGE